MYLPTLIYSNKSSDWTNAPPSVSCGLSSSYICCFSFYVEVACLLLYGPAYPCRYVWQSAFFGLKLFEAEQNPTSFSNYATLFPHLKGPSLLKTCFAGQRVEQIKMSTETKFYQIQNAPLYWFFFFFFYLLFFFLPPPPPPPFFFFFFSAAELTRLRFAVINRNLNNPVEAVGLWRYSLIGYPSNPPLRHVINDQCWNF